jgi:Domain of unknown function (DUF4124)
MNKILQGIIFTAGLAGAATAQAAAYKCTDDSGRIVYSDIPCAKKAPPPPKAEPAKAVSKAEAAVMTRITEADVLRAVTQAEEYTTRNNHAELCGMFAEGLKFRFTNQLVTPAKVNQGGRNDMCAFSRENAEQSKRTGMVQSIERGPTKVTIEPGETRASVSYDSVVNLTRYDRIISSYHCSSRERWVLADGKLLYVAVEGTCKP